jgi:NAD(P)-dependent dehydrogenase (short-subunit alcohol dehydrogenase family)
MDLELEGKNSLITGGSAGLGLALAELPVGEGARVCIFARGAERMKQANRRLHELGGEETFSLLGDVTDPDPDRIQRLIFTLEDNWDRPDAFTTPTSVSRAAGLALTKALSRELAPEQIRVNADGGLCPVA